MNRRKGPARDFTRPDPGKEHAAPMGTNNVVFLEVIEWFDESGREIVHRIPEEGSGEIKFGAQLIVRESQAAVFFYNGKAIHAFRPGRHTLITANIPILTKILAIPWGATSPLRAETWFANLKTFTNLKWGTRDPVAFRDQELGLLRLRAFGVFNIRIVQPLLLINRLVGTQGMFTTDEIEEYLSQVIVSRFNDHMGEHLDTLTNLPGRYDDLSRGLQTRLQQDFSHFGLALTGLYINAVTPPPEVQKAIDDKSRMSVFDDLNRLLKMKAAMALEKSSESPDGAGSALGMGLGFMMPALFADYFKPDRASAPDSLKCPECGGTVSRDDTFCPQCGHQLIVFSQCLQCGKNLPPNARFCSRCGLRVEEVPPAKRCAACGVENLFDAVYCNHCGEKL